MTLDNTTYKLPNGVVVKNDGPAEAAMKARPKDTPIEIDDWDRSSSGVGRQLRLDIYLDDLVAMSKQFDILLEFARRAKLAVNDRDKTVRQALLTVDHYHHYARAKLEEAAPSQQLRIQIRRERKRALRKSQDAQ